MIILLLSLVRLCLQTRSWSTALRQDGIHSNTTELMFLRLASQGIGYLTVLGPVASEPIKIRLLERYGRSATAATLVDTGLYWFSGALVLIAGSVSAPAIFAHSQRASLLLASIVGIGILILMQPKLFLRRLTSSLSKTFSRLADEGGPNQERNSKICLPAPCCDSSDVFARPCVSVAAACRGRNRTLLSAPPTLWRHCPLDRSDEPHGEDDRWAVTSTDWS